MEKIGEKPFPKIVPASNRQFGSTINNSKLKTNETQSSN
jgi:hypothetical protein